MRKLFLTSVSIFIAFCCVAQDDGVQSPLYDTAYNIEEEELDTKVESDFAKEVLGDTTITFNDFSVKKDTVSALKLKKEYSWITNIDSFLLAQKKEERKQSKITSKENSGSSFLSNFFSCCSTSFYSIMDSSRASFVTPSFEKCDRMTRQ